MFIFILPSGDFKKTGNFFSTHMFLIKRNNNTINSNKFFIEFLLPLQIKTTSIRFLAKNYFYIKCYINKPIQYITPILFQYINKLFTCFMR